jgi:transposase
MKRRMKRKDVKNECGQRWQSETVNSMLKRNMGSSLRARTPETREMEMRLRVLTHNIMLLANLKSDDRN